MVDKANVAVLLIIIIDIFVFNTRNNKFINIDIVTQIYKFYTNISIFFFFIDLVIKKVRENVEETLIKASQPFSGLWHCRGHKVIQAKVIFSSQFSAISIQLRALSLNRIDEECLGYVIFF